jgi:hypothetical protein
MVLLNPKCFLYMCTNDSLCYFSKKMCHFNYKDTIKSNMKVDSYIMVYKKMNYIKRYFVP